EVTGTSKSQLYHYFEDRTALVRAVVVRQGERVLGLHRPALEAIDGWAALKRWRDLSLRLVKAADCHGGCPVGSLANELAEIDENSRTDLVDIFGEWQEMIAQAIGRMVASGELRADADPNELAVMMLASFQAGLLLAKTTRSAQPLKIALDSAIGYLR